MVGKLYQSQGWARGSLWMLAITADRESTRTYSIAQKNQAQKFENGSQKLTVRFCADLNPKLIRRQQACAAAC